MTTNQTWAEALNINEEILSEWSTQAPEGMPLLVWGIEQGFIDFEAYKAWAQAQFGVAYLENHFFSENFNPSSIASDGHWKPWTFPVDNWEDTPIIACAELPSEELRGNSVYILADPREMRKAWDKSKAEFDAPIGISMAPPKPFVLNLDAHLQPKAAQVNLPQFSNLFTALQSKFPSALVMKCFNDEAHLFKWSESLKPENSNYNLKLNAPTFLRIVAKTLKPYHGFLVDSPAHREFFTSLGLEELPACITAIPIKNENSLLGLVIAIGNEQNQKIDSLNFAELEVQGWLGTHGGDWLSAA